jgi:hypothetical protein
MRTMGFILLMLGAGLMYVGVTGKAGKVWYALRTGQVLQDAPGTGSPGSNPPAGPGTDPGVITDPLTDMPPPGGWNSGGGSV